MDQSYDTLSAKPYNQILKLRTEKSKINPAPKFSDDT